MFFGKLPLKASCLFARPIQQMPRRKQVRAILMNACPTQMQHLDAGGALTHIKRVVGKIKYQKISKGTAYVSTSRKFQP
jgi:hypothetical protein